MFLSVEELDLDPVYLGPLSPIPNIGPQLVQDAQLDLPSDESPWNYHEAWSELYPWTRVQVSSGWYAQSPAQFDGSIYLRQANVFTTENAEYQISFRGSSISNNVDMRVYFGANNYQVVTFNTGWHTFTIKGRWGATYASSDNYDNHLIIIYIL